jgi:hypothetical protein
VSGDRVEQLGEHGGIDVPSSLLDQACPEMDVAEQLALGGRGKKRRRAELTYPTDVVQERSGEQEIGAQPRVELRRLAAERRDGHRVFQQAARPRLVAVHRGRQ